MIDLVWAVNELDVILPHLAREKKIKTLAIPGHSLQKGALAVVGAWWENRRNGLIEEVSKGEVPGPVEGKQQRG